MTSAWEPRCSMSLSLQAPVDERAARAERGWELQHATRFIVSKRVSTGAATRGLLRPLTQPPPPLRGCAGISRIPRRRRLRMRRSGGLAGLAGVSRAGRAPALGGRRSSSSDAPLPLPMASDDLLVELEAAW
eukprot:scaffold13052_cov63-Phaeocystis_antarctica.AAC.2